MNCDICVFNVDSNLCASKLLPWFKAAILSASAILNWVIASFLAAFWVSIVAAKLVINCFVWLSLEALNWEAAFWAAWSVNITCCLFCVLTTSACWALVKLVMSICKNDWAFNTAFCWALDKLAISILAKLTAFCIVACCVLLKLVNSKVLNRLELEITVCCLLVKFKTSKPAIVWALAKATCWLLFKLAKPICCCNWALVIPACCKLAKFDNLICWFWFAVAKIDCCWFTVLSWFNSWANCPVIILAFISFSAFDNSVWKFCCAVRTLACCSLVKFCDALCCKAVAFDWAIGKADCMIAFIKASLPIEDLLKPLAAKLDSTLSTAPLAHAGIFPLSIPSSRVDICEDTKASVGKEATAAWTAGGWFIIVAVIWAGFVPTAAWISAGSVAVCPVTVAAVPWSTWAKAPEDNCPVAAWAIEELVGAAVAPAAVPVKVPVTVPTCEPVLSVPCCAVAVCAVPVCAVIWAVVKAPGAEACVEVPVVGVANVSLVIATPDTLVGAVIVVPLIISSGCTACEVYAWVAEVANSGFATCCATYLSMYSDCVPIVCCCGWEAVGTFVNFLASSPTANFFLCLFKFTLFILGIIIIYLFKVV